MCASVSMRVNNVLNEVFKIDEFRSCQRDVVSAIIKKKDCFVNLPTGAGKSLCYLLPGALADDQTTVVDSPLLSLIEDQKSKLEKLGISVRIVTGTISEADIDRISAEALHGVVQFMYTTPEKFVSKNFAKKLKELNESKKVAHIVLDEIHCAYEYRHNFRLCYDQLPSAVSQLRNVPLILVTATATKCVRDFLVREYNMNTCAYFATSMHRKNLTLAVVEKAEKLPTQQIIEWIKSKHPKSVGIVYCMRVDDSETIADALKSAGVEFWYFANGILPMNSCKMNQDVLMGDKT